MKLITLWCALFLPCRCSAEAEKKQISLPELKQEREVRGITALCQCDVMASFGGHGFQLLPMFLLCTVSS